MALMTLTRREWVAVVNELDGAAFDNVPPGLSERIRTVLSSTPAAWPEQACMVDLTDQAAVELVHAIVRRCNEQPINPRFVWQEESSIAEAERIIRNHQDQRLSD